MTPEQEDWIGIVGAEDGEGCRDWPWRQNPYGYGYVWLKRRNTPVGHLTLAASGKPRPEVGGRSQLHSCDRRICSAPWHLRWGTQAENLADARSRNRMNEPFGERHAHHKLTDERVAFARTHHEFTNVELAAMFGVTITAISMARRGKTWQHVTTPPTPNRATGTGRRFAA